MNHTEFKELHADSVALMRSYFAEAEKSSAMLAECTAEPLPLEKRLALTSQGIVEQEAHLRYLVGIPGESERDSGMKPNSFRPIPERCSASRE